MRLRLSNAPKLLGALGILLVAASGDAAPRPTARARSVPRALAPAQAVGTVDAPVRGAVAASRPPGTSWPAVKITNRNTGARASLSLYGADGAIDDVALHAFMRVASTRDDVDVVEPLDPRLVQLVFRAAYHFGATSLVLISATRAGSHGKHGSGDALDFQLDGVSAAKLAAYMRTYPRAGIGIYTHPRTQYAHLDVRERSYHWLDGSPPGVTWRERLLKDPRQEKRDASWDPTMDLPEAAPR